MLLAYLINAVSIESFHHAVHDHDHAVSHTLEDETDACHRAIYHGDLELGCEHKTHIHETHVDCDLCNVTLIRDYFYSTVLFDFRWNNKSSDQSYCEASSISKAFEKLYSYRGPPVS